MNGQWQEYEEILRCIMNANTNTSLAPATSQGHPITFLVAREDVQMIGSI